jgi:RNA polymerase sigma-70 factor, ECF subfamily
MGQGSEGAGGSHGHLLGVQVGDIVETRQRTERPAAAPTPARGPAPAKTAPRVARGAVRCKAEVGLNAADDAFAAVLGDPPRRTLRVVDVDLELFTRLRNGDEDAFVMLVARYQQPMLRLACAYVPNRAVAEEAVQDTWMGVVKGIDRFEGRSAFKTWLFGILINRARSAGSLEQRQATLEPHHAVDPIRFDASGQWADPVEPWAETDDRLEAATWSPILQSGLEDLPPRQRLVVVLRDVEGLSSGEVCDLLDIAAGNQRILLHRGRSRLREILEAQIAKA